MLAAWNAGVAADKVDVHNDDVLGFLQGLLGPVSPPGHEGAPPPAAAAAAAPATAALRLHPRVDCYHPLGEAHTDRQVVDALALYRHFFRESYLCVEEVVASGDTALALGTQHVTNYLAGAHELLPVAVQQWFAQLLPKLTDGRVPTAIQLSIGKDDAGRPVVTKLVVTFNLLAALLPHLELPQWQQQLLDDTKPLLLEGLLAAGKMSAMVEDLTIAAGAAWRPMLAMAQASAGTVLRTALATAQQSLLLARSMVFRQKQKKH